MAVQDVKFSLSFALLLSTAAVAPLGCGGGSGPARGAADGASADGADSAEEAADEAPAAGAKAKEGGGEPADARDAPGANGKVTRPKGLLTRAEAQQYVLALVNRDRVAEKLPPVRWDGIAAEAGQRHANDMAKLGFTGHHGSDGSVPELRYTGAGGEGLVMENAGCFGDAVARELDPDPRFTPESVERVQATFMAEKPPADGHRRNILMPGHTSLGVGLAKVKGIDVACMAQEFVDDYGRYEPVPKKAKVGDMIHVAGEVRSPASIAGVGLSRVEPGKPRKPEELLKMGGYPIPAPFVTYFPKGYKTPKPLSVAGNRFSIDVPLSDKGRPGLYGVSVWATFPGSPELRMISLRTISVEKP